MSQLTEGLNELERELRDIKPLPALAQVAKLPGLVLMLFALLSSIVHAVERNGVILNELKRKSDGEI